MGSPTTAGSMALAGLRVLDLSQVLAGPYCTMMLADLGAEVIKVERPITGDGTRGWGPPFAGGESAYFLCANRNKRSLTLDLKHPRARELARALALRSDVLVHNLRVGAAERLGLGYHDLKDAHPRLVYCAISAFGADDPAARPGYDALIQAESGLMSITGAPDGEPTKVGVAIVDVLTALFATNGILAALAHRERSGAGQRVDVALRDAAVAALVNQAQSALVTGEAPGRLGNAHPNIVPYQTFRTADGHVMLAVGTDAQFARLCGALDLGDLAGDPRFAANAGRVEHRERLIQLLQVGFARETTAHWVAALAAADVPAGPIKDLTTVFADPELRQRQMLAELQHPSIGALSQVGNPIKLSDTPPRLSTPPPTVGQHTAEILGELGVSAAELATLREQGVI